MKRRTFLTYSMAVPFSGGLITLAACGGSSGGGTDISDNITGVQTSLNIPPLLEMDENNAILLTAQTGQSSFIDSVSQATWGYNGVYLGPTIRVRKDDTVNFTVTNNNIGEDITTHWHGLHIPGEVDGTPYQRIANGDSWAPTLEIAQEASTNWYHSHIHGRTSEHVYKGMAGMFIIEDTNSDALDLPKTYGEDDIPLIVQDKLFNDDGTMELPSGGRFLGNTILVNGTVNPVLEVQRKKVRFRLLNGSNARFYQFRMSDGSAFKKIATEGGFLNEPVTMNSLIMGPGERNEIVIDFSGYDIGDEITLISDDLDNGTGNTFDIIQFIVVEATLADSTLPLIMNTVPSPDDFTTVTNHSFDLGGGAIGIDGAGRQSFDMMRNDLTVTKGEYQKWTISGGHHTFHVHGCSFLILTRGGVAPSAADAGWKDTVIVENNEDVEFVVRFNYSANALSRYMFHCHILGHEDNGMMGQFEVI